MKLSREQVDHVAELAKLALSDEERDLFQDQLSEILDYAARLQELHIDEPAAGDHAFTPNILGSNVLRDDQARPSLAPDDVLANAPAVEDGCFRVPVVLDRSAPTPSAAREDRE